MVGAAEAADVQEIALFRAGQAHQEVATMVVDMVKAEPVQRPERPLFVSFGLAALAAPHHSLQQTSVLNFLEIT